MKTGKILANLFLVVSFSIVFSACGKKVDNKNNLKTDLKTNAEAEKEKEKKAEEEKQLKQKKEAEEKERVEKELKEKELANKKLFVKPAPPITPAIKEMPKPETLKPNEQMAPVKPIAAASPTVLNESTKGVPVDTNPKNAGNGDDEVPPAPELDIENEKIEFCVLSSLKNYSDVFKKESKIVITALELNKIFTTIYVKCKTQGASAEINAKEKFMILNLFIVKVNEIRSDLISEVEKFKMGILGIAAQTQEIDKVTTVVEDKPQNPQPVDAESVLKMIKSTAELKVSQVRITGRKNKNQSDATKIVYDVKQTLNHYDLALSDINGNKVSKKINFEIQDSSSSESTFDFSFFKRLFNMESKSEVKWKYELDVEANGNNNHNLVIDEEGNRSSYEVKVLKGNIKEMIKDETGKTQVQIVMTHNSWNDLSKRILQDFVKKESADTAGVLKNFNLKTEPIDYARTCNLNSFSLACTDPQYVIRGEN
ncbi:MAG: hypothetical protein L6Q37_04855 [Bdellovibrionaceae bacterium]|nr:hypothetical protein [Pseudobdellovibrionaceae bacterium]NUM57465.1 hypothetical protein [Pseudobdellovibrionaceae bacterium]